MPYTREDYEIMARRVQFRRDQANALVFTGKEWDILYTALGIAVAHERAIERRINFDPEIPPK